MKQQPAFPSQRRLGRNVTVCWNAFRQPPGTPGITRVSNHPISYCRAVRVQRAPAAQPFLVVPSDSRNVGTRWRPGRMEPRRLRSIAGRGHRLLKPGLAPVGREFVKSPETALRPGLATQSGRGAKNNDPVSAHASQPMTIQQPSAMVIKIDEQRHPRSCENWCWRLLH